MSTPSRLELTLIYGGYALVKRFFARWPLDCIFCLTRVNFRTHSLIRGYVALRWDHQSLLSRWVANVDRLLETLGTSGSFICGPTVADFFVRGTSSSTTLDICVATSGFAALTEVINMENYRLGSQPMFVSSFRPAITEKMFSFVFSRGDTEATVVVHLVRGDPLDLIIHCATSTGTLYVSYRTLTLSLCDPANSMNFITSKHAISVFPRSSFVDRTFLASSQRTFSTTSVEYIAPLVRNTTGLAIMSASPKRGREVRERRRVGDTLCWVLPLTLSSGPPVGKHDGIDHVSQSP